VRLHDQEGIEKVTPVIKEKIKALLRAQVEFDPEPVISQLDKGNPIPAARLFCVIIGDLEKRVHSITAYAQKVAAVMDEIKEQLS
jgi:hypothetical protein